MTQDLKSDTKMSSIMHMVVENYNKMLDIDKDPDVDSWPFMGSAAPVLLILAVYLYFVLHLGPKFMEKRKPYDLKLVMIAYNAIQVVFSIWLVCKTLSLENYFPNVFINICSKTSTFNKNFHYNSYKCAWWYFLSKCVELLDTVFFVMRKKQSQVSFLHLYHHFSTTLSSWAYLKYLPGEQGLLVGTVNTLVHVVMYTYYFLAALGPQFQKYLWWKKYITKIQLTQFAIIMTYIAITTALDCRVSKALSCFFFANCAILMYLFTDFYRKAYKNNKSTKEYLVQKSS